MQTEPVSTPAAQEPEQLLERAREGDDRALEQLLESVQPQLYRFSMRMCRHPEDAEDVLQDSMLTLARNFRQYRGDARLSTWLYTVARSICIKKRRKSKFAPEHEDSWEQLDAAERDQMPALDASPEQHASDLQVWERVQRAISLLNPEQREVLVLRDIEGLTAPEVAEVVGVSVSAVKSRLHRARAQLRELLSGGAQARDPACPDIVATYSRYLEDELTPEICNTMQAHIDSCSSCSAECDGLKQALNVCSNAPYELPPEVAQRVQDALRAAIKGRSTALK